MSLPVSSLSLKAERPPILRRVLPNGMTVLIQRDPAHPLVAYQAVVRTGSAFEGPMLGTGVSHVVEHMLFKGTARRPVGAVEKEAQSYGGTSQGFTTYDTTSYQLVVNKEFWAQAADLLVDALFNPAMDPEEFKKEREVVLRELKLRHDDPDQVAWDLLFSNAFRVHPYRTPIIGVEPMVNKLTREQTLQYHRSHYLPNEIVIGVVGDVDPEQVAKKLEELCAGIPPGSVAPAVLPEEPVPVAPREVVQEAQVALGVALVGFPSVSIGNPDLYPLDLLGWVLGGGRGSRLDRSLKERGIVHSVGAWNYTPLHPGLFVISMRMDADRKGDNDRMPEALKEMFKELARAREELFTPAELQRAKRAMLHGYLADRQTVTAQAADLAGYEVLVGDPYFARRYLEGVERVTLEDLRRVAARYLKPERATVVKLLPRGGAETGEPVGPATVEKPTVEKITLKNGMRVLLRPDHRLGLVTFQVSMLGGIRFETEKTNGGSGLTARMLLRGTGTRTAQEITEQVREMGGELSPFSGRNSIGLGMEVVSSERVQALRLLADLILDPTFPAEELEKERRLALAEIKTKEEDPFPWGMRRLAATLFTVHPYRFDPSGTPESISGLSREDLLSFYRRIRNTQRMVLSLIGDFKKEELLPILEETFGKIPPPSQDVKELPIPKEPPLSMLREHREQTPRQEALVMVGFRGLSVTDPRVPALDLVETILSGGAGRLFSEVRERRGLAYTVGCFSVHGADPGSFVLYAVTDPSHLESVRAALLEEVRRLRESAVAKEELAQAQQGLLGGRRIARQTFGALAAQIGLDELYGLGYNFAEEYDTAVAALAPQDLQQVAVDLLDPQRCVVVIGLPGSDSR